MIPATVPPPMPGDVCIEVLWELAHSPAIQDESERQRLIENLTTICRENLVEPIYAAPQIQAVWKP